MACLNVRSKLSKSPDEIECHGLHLGAAQELFHSPGDSPAASQPNTGSVP